MVNINFVSSECIIVAIIVLPFQIEGNEKIKTDINVSSSYYSITWSSIFMSNRCTGFSG